MVPIHKDVSPLHRYVVFVLLSPNPMLQASAIAWGRLLFNGTVNSSCRKRSTNDKYADY